MSSRIVSEIEYLLLEWKSSKVAQAFSLRSRDYDVQPAYR